MTEMLLDSRAAQHKDADLRPTPTARMERLQDQHQEHSTTRIVAF